VYRAVLDTNVIVSGLISPLGAPGKILELLADGTFVLILSAALVHEARRALRRPRIRKYVRLSDEEIELRIAQLETLADPVEGKLELEVAVRDPNDVMVIIAGVEGRADYLVTGDDDLLSLGEYERIAIVTPRAFLEVLRG
jgi:uncharacterized protein